MSRHEQAVTVQAGPQRDGKPLPPGDVLVRTFNDLRDELISALIFVLGNPEDARDAAQDAFVKCWNARDQLDAVRNLRAWIFRVCFNTAKDMRRSAWHRKSRPLRAEQYIMPARDFGPVHDVERQESFERIRQAVLGLRTEEKEVFLLRQNGELTYEQIAEQRGCPVSTVKTQMRTALEKIRKVLN
jgi:RNA polymerase sigma-70 factor (ECF subfamily)